MPIKPLKDRVRQLLLRLQDIEVRQVTDTYMVRKYLPHFLQITHSTFPSAGWIEGKKPTNHVANCNSSRPLHHWSEKTICNPGNNDLVRGYSSQWHEKHGKESGSGVQGWHHNNITYTWNHQQTDDVNRPISSFPRSIRNNQRYEERKKPNWCC